MMNKLYPLMMIVAMACGLGAEDAVSPTATTFCNPLDISYRFQLEEPSRREAADPTVVWFRDRYYLFASKSGGYWHSQDLIRWEFIETDGIPTEEYAPCAVALDDTLFFLASSNEKSTLYKSDDPLSGKWSVAREELNRPVWDPAFYLDEDGRLYLYWGCSDVNPIYGVEVDVERNFEFIGEPVPLIHQNPARFGWENPGDYNTLTKQRPWIEGPWMNKRNGVYYLQYAGPGTEFKSYADGVYTSEHALGPFQYQPHNPFAYKPEGFAAGAGHGSTFQDRHGNYWHIGTVTISQKHMFERRLALFPTWFAGDGTLYTDTRYGDFPLRMPQKAGATWEDVFPGWMLLSFGKPVKVSSEIEGHPSGNMNDEDIRSYWAAASGGDGEWAMMDLGAECEIRAIQLNFAEHNTRLFGREQGIVHRYTVLASDDGDAWIPIVERSANRTDNSHAYFEISDGLRCRYLKVVNHEVPGGHFAMSGFRVFGNGVGLKPHGVSDLKALRNPDDRRCVTLEWSSSEDAVGHVIRYGIAPDQLYHSYMVYRDRSVTIRSLDSEMHYFYTIETFNENGITPSGLLVED